jgi:hypothetical protein
MKKLLTLCTAALWLAACDEPSNTEDGGMPSLKFLADTALTVNWPSDDVDSATAGFQYDVVVQPTNNSTNSKVIFKVGDVTQATESFVNGKATGRLTFHTRDAGTDTANFVTAVRETSGDIGIAWIFTVHSN